MEKLTSKQYELESKRGKKIKSEFDKLPYEKKLKFFEKRYELPHMVNTNQIIPDDPGKKKMELI